MQSYKTQGYRSLMEETKGHFLLSLAPLPEGQRAIVMALCPSLVLAYVHQSVRPCVRP